MTMLLGSQSIGSSKKTYLRRIQNCGTGSTGRGEGADFDGLGDFGFCRFPCGLSGFLGEGSDISTDDESTSVSNCLMASVAGGKSADRWHRDTQVAANNRAIITKITIAPRRSCLVISKKSFLIATESYWCKNRKNSSFGNLF